MRGGVSQQPVEVTHPDRTLTGQFDHGPRHVEPSYLAGRPYQARECYRGGAAAASDVEHPLARLHGGQRDGGVGHRRQCRIHLLLLCDPAGDSGPVPKGQLLGMEDRCIAHEMVPSGETSPNDAVWKQNTFMPNSLQAQTLLTEEDGNERAAPMPSVTGP